MRTGKKYGKFSVPSAYARWLKLHNTFIEKYIYGHGASRDFLFKDKISIAIDGSLR
jgi:hypothetical protein